MRRLSSLLALLLLTGCYSGGTLQKGKDEAVQWERQRVTRLIQSAANKRAQAQDNKSATVLLGVLSQIAEGK